MESEPSYFKCLYIRSFRRVVEAENDDYRLPQSSFALIGNSYIFANEAGHTRH
jgi:hypothetical protein